MLRQALCVCKSLSRVSRRSASRPRVTNVEVNARVVLRCACLCFWRALGQSAQAEKDTLILCSKQESVVLHRQLNGKNPSRYLRGSRPLKGTALRAGPRWLHPS